MGEKVITIYIVDDNDDDRYIVQEILTGLKITAKMIFLESPDKLHELLKANSYIYQLVLLDINMPGKTGFEVLAEIKNDSAISHIPITMLTTSSRPEDVKLSYSLGACGFIKKPDSLEDYEKIFKVFIQYWNQISLVPEP